MKNKSRKKLILVAITFLLSTSFVAPTVASAATFGNSNNGASSVEQFQIRYSGAAWNYKKNSGKNYAYFKYSRNGKTLLTKYAYNGKSTGSVWDSLSWNGPITKFNWGNG